jgi:LPS sulfotransferase NodH
MPTHNSGSSRVVVLAHPRSGSNSLVEILERHRSVSIINEPFNEHFTSWHPGNRDYVSRLRAGESMGRLLDELFADFTGLKVLSYQLNDAELKTLLDRGDVRIIALRRRNLLQTAVSQVVAEATGLWKTWDADRPLEDYYQGLPPLDVGTVARRLEWSRDEAARVIAAVSNLGSDRVVRIDYEDLYEASLGDARALVNSIWTFLGLEAVEGPEIDHFLSDAVRQARPSTYGQIPNLAEVEAALGNDDDGHLRDWVARSG